MMERVIYDQIEQGTPEWHTLRSGIITASMFDTVMAKGKGGRESKTRRTYMLTLIGQRLTGEIIEGYTNAHMERGKVMENEARQLYSLTCDVEVQQVGFIKIGDDIGASPDGLIGSDGDLEIKTKLPHLHLDCLLRDEVPSEHIKQIQGQLWVADREWCDFVSFWPGLPIFIKRVHRDGKLIAEIRQAVDVFISEMRETMEQINKIGG